MTATEFKPHTYQQYCIDRVVSDPAVGLFLRPGLGKTVITLTAIHELKYYMFCITKALVIAPKKVAEATWTKETNKWEHLKDMRVVPVLGSERKRIAALSAVADVYVINRDNVKWLVEYYKQKWPFEMVILDESTSFKNSRTERFKALKLIRRFVERIVLLTGTPSSRGLMDLWAQVYLLDQGERLGRTITQYRERYFDPDKRNATQIWSYKPKSDAEKAVLDAISDICITMKAEDYLELPDCIEQEIPVVLSDKARRGYDAFERDLLLEIDDDVITASAASVLTGKLLQYCNGAVYDNDKVPVRVHDCKIEAFMELIERLQGESALVFYSFQHDLDRLTEALKKTNLRVRVYKGVQDEEAWNAGEIDILLAHPQSCAYGLNLQAGGRHIIWFGLNWSFELNDQGKCRLWRQGAERTVYVHYLVVQNSVDEDVMAAIKERTSTHETIMNVLRARIDKVRKENENENS